MNPVDVLSNSSRRRFLRQSFAFSALATLGSYSSSALPTPTDPSGAELLMIGDWDTTTHHEGQAGVAKGMRTYVQQQGIKTQALLMLGDNWYGSLEGGAHSPRWRAQFEEMYPADIFNCPAYAILGNHDYQRWPGQ